MAKTDYAGAGVRSNSRHLGGASAETAGMVRPPGLASGSSYSYDQVRRAGWTGPAPGGRVAAVVSPYRFRREGPVEPAGPRSFRRPGRGPTIRLQSGLADSHLTRP